LNAALWFLLGLLLILLLLSVSYRATRLIRLRHVPL
jgi:hypothetical protein